MPSLQSLRARWYGSTGAVSLDVAAGAGGGSDTLGACGSSALTVPVAVCADAGCSRGGVGVSMCFGAGAGAGAGGTSLVTTLRGGGAGGGAMMTGSWRGRGAAGLVELLERVVATCDDGSGGDARDVSHSC